MSRWHNLTDEQVLEIFNRHAWRATILSELRAIARDPRHATEDRLGALQTLNEGFVFGIFAPDTTYPAFAATVSMQCVQGTRRRWWHNWRIRRASEQLVAIRHTLRTIQQFLPSSQPELNRGAMVAKQESLPS